MFTTALAHHHAPGEGGKCPCKGTLPSALSDVAADPFLSRLSVFTLAEYGATDALHPAKATAVDFSGYTPLHLAARHGRSDAVERLLSLKADPNANECGATPLHRAAFSGHLEVCRLLLDAGARVDLADASTGDGRSALFKAIDQEHEDVVLFLLSRGASMEYVSPSTGERIDQVAKSASMRRLLGLPEAAARREPPAAAGPRAEEAAAKVEIDCAASRELKGISCYACSLPALILKRSRGDESRLMCSACFARDAARP